MVNTVNNAAAAMDPPSSADAGRSLNTAMEVLGRKTMCISELEAENASLRVEVEALRHNYEKPQPTKERYDSLTSKYNELAKTHRELETRHAKCQPHIELATRRFYKAKEICRQWQVYHDRKRVEKAAAIFDGGPQPTHHQSIAPEGSFKDEAPEHDGEEKPRPLRTGKVAEIRPILREAPGNEADTAGLPLDMAAEQAIVDQGLHAGRTSSRTLRVTSSQTTDAGSDPANIHSSPPGNREPSSDSEPIVVSARTLKRKRSASVYAMPPPVRVKQEPNSPERPIEIKSEDYSSPVERRINVARQETSDLDALAESYTTPRKHRTRQRAVSEDIARRPALVSRVSSLSDSDVAEPAIHQLDTKLQPMSEIMRPGKQLEPAFSAQDFAPRRTTSRVTDHALRPLSVNVPPKRRLDHARPTMKRKRSDEDAATKVALVSEDGESEPLHPIERSSACAGDKATPKTHISRRLDTMLDGPSPDRQRLAMDNTPESAVPRNKRPLTPVSVQVFRSKPTKEASPSLRIVPDPNTVSKAARSSRQVSPKKPAEHRFKRPQGIEDSPPPMRPEDEPLRLRPLDALRLEDFKINPKYMDSEFAFADTLRSRDQRRCLQGCTKPDCCGDAFLKAVEMGGFGGSTKSDEEVLEGYLGPNWKQIMGAYPRDKRDDLLMQARASAFANQYGKHRHAFERRSTPPGFWRTDMPSTQEAAEDREKAQEMVRKKIEERWRDAMRDGEGRWLFRDE